MGQYGKQKKKDSGQAGMTCRVLKGQTADNVVSAFSVEVREEGSGA
jgi:hypothetical protein